MFRANHPALLTPNALPSVALRAATTPAAPVDGPHPRDLPENQYSYRPPPQPHPASQPPLAPPTFHATHPLTPFSDADSHSGFAAPSHAVVPLIPSLPESSAVFLFPSLSPSQPHRRALSPRAITLPVPPHHPSLRPLASFVRYPSLALCPSFPLDIPQGLAVSLGLVCRLGQPPLLAKRSSKATGAG